VLDLSRLIPDEGVLMQITFIGHAGIFIETNYGSILCDPWFNPAYFASWFPFPSNEQVDKGKLRQPTYLYLSHQHHDHFDPRFLREHVSKETTVILPDFPLPLLERALREIGFTKFIPMKNYQTRDLGGLRLTSVAMVAPTDGPLGDSSLIVNDGETRIFNQNDSRPIDLDILADFGPYDAHFVQFSGAIWYPMVYQFPQKMKDTLGRKKRENEMARALNYIKHLDASFVVPSAGPPCFLDDDLFYLNDFERDPINVFPDQTVFIEYMQEHERDNGRLMIPSSVMTLKPGQCTITHPLPDEEVRAIFTDKRAYLEAYQARQRPVIEAAKKSWPRGQVDIVASLRDWFEPLLQMADITCVGVNGRLLLDCGEQAAVIDFQQRAVYPWRGEEWEYRFGIDAALIESSIVRHVEDWVNDLFLSCRFEAERKGPFNEYIYNFFKGLTPERINYIEGYYAEQSLDQQFWETHGYRIQRRCPHLKADLTRFARIEDGILTCTMHGWQFELATGRCLTSDDRKLYSQRIDADGDPINEAGEPVEAMTLERPAPTQCKECWYRPEKAAQRKAGRSF
jgi:UDP-MurNAc hydroxylase